ncbi:unnamed protein product, partial [Chrysoparadoxa australica]
FVRSHLLPIGFKFHVYVKDTMQHHVCHFLDIKVSVWLLLAVVMVIEGAVRDQWTTPASYLIVGVLLTVVELYLFLSAQRALHKVLEKTLLQEAYRVRDLGEHLVSLDPWINGDSCLVPRKSNLKVAEFNNSGRRGMKRALSHMMNHDLRRADSLGSAGSDVFMKTAGP